MRLSQLPTTGLGEAKISPLWNTEPAQRRGMPRAATELGRDPDIMRRNVPTRPLTCPAAAKSAHISHIKHILYI